jgi:hypothetical protein
MLDAQNQLLQDIGRERSGLKDMRSEQDAPSETNESDKDKRAKEREEDLKKFL